MIPMRNTRHALLFDYKNIVLPCVWGGGDFFVLRGGFSMSSMSLRTLSKFHRFVSENKIIMILMKMRFMMKRIINDFRSVALPRDLI